MTYDTLHQDGCIDAARTYVCSCVLRAATFCL
jgi:hypothetical protein